MVLEGSFPLYNEFFETHEHEAPAEGWTWRDSHHFTKEQEQWFLERGCKWKKVEAGPGDVILWDSRCMHYGAAAKGDRPRIATCKLSLSPSVPLEPCLTK
jgi:ectoine hydroxylase-related dioxygenase (phytanoyl-CoA dioxygenase family)